ncbi:MAG: hypothetical protein LT080_16250 [Thiobacillus sp.]|nr:hypothetical protein [Thiobacillus sp.]
MRQRSGMTFAEPPYRAGDANPFIDGISQTQAGGLLLQLFIGPPADDPINRRTAMGMG